MRTQVQKFGKLLSGMVMPNIGAFIAWGFITALFIPMGWFPHEKLAGLVGPVLKYLLPLLIAYTGGRNVAGERGGVIGAIAAMGIIVGSDIPMFIGAMAMGPFAGWAIKKFDHMVEGKVPAGFEMLVSNFSLGILGMGYAILGFYTIGPVVVFLTGLLSSGVGLIMDKGLLPLASVFIEPAKVLFLNNAINHGILTPIGLEQAQEAGYSILFLLEANPGPGLGVLLAYWMFSKGNMKNSVPGAVVIHFLGGIHEIYFPYILMKPALIIAPVLGSASAILVYSLLGGGLVAPASPGSIIAMMAMSPKGKLLIVLLGVAVAATVSFLVASPMIRRMYREDEKDNASKETSEKITIKKDRISRIVFACDAGMGSSTMGATRFRNRLQKQGINIRVENCPVDRIPAGADVVVCQAALAPRVQGSASGAELVVIGNFLGDRKLDALFERVKNGAEGVDHIPEEPVRHDHETNGHSVLTLQNIRVGLESTTKEEAIRKAGELLVQGGYVNEGYIEAMLQREELATTYLGTGIAIPHGTSEAKEKILKTGMVVLQYPQGVWFGNEKAHLVIGIAAQGNEHIDILARLSSSLDDGQLLQKLVTTTDKRFILETLG
ncbi:MAG: PTS mannitol transporter subunit IICBA [Mangrovibacterium sp.]